MKLCKDCKWVSNATFWNPECMHPNNSIISPVTGDREYKKDAPESCRIHRVQGTFWSWWLPACGIKGNWYESKNGS